MISLLLSLILSTDLNSFNMNEFKNEHKCLSQTIYHESRGEPLEGQVAVAKVVINRKSHKEFPDTICDVVFQKRQFEWTTLIPKSKWRTSHKTDMLALTMLIAHKGNEDGKMFFSVGGFKNPRLEFNSKIGGHKFYNLRSL